MEDHVKRMQENTNRARLQKIRKELDTMTIDQLKLVKKYIEFRILGTELLLLD